jgi:hypothetical protein
MEITSSVGAASSGGWRNMPLLTELENVLGCDFYKDFAPDGAGGWRDFIWTKFLRGSNFKL